MMSTQTDPEDILYGNYLRHRSGDDEDWHPENIDINELHLADDGHFVFAGFRGCSEWMAKTESLPDEWLKGSHYSPQNERSAGALFRRLHLQDRPRFREITKAAWIHGPGSPPLPSSAGDPGHVLVETEERQYRVSADKLAAVELLNTDEGEWRVYPYGADPDHPLLLYVAGDDQLLGLVRI